MAEGKEKKTTHQNHKRPSASFLLTLCPERLFGGSPYSLLPTLAARLGRSATPQRRPSGGVPQAAAPSPRPASPRRGRPPPSPPMRAGAVTAPRHGAAAKMAKVSEMYDVTWEDMRDKMRKWREENYRNSEQIVDVGEELINEYASKLGDDIWIIYEQVMIAALDCSRDDLAMFCLQELRRQFPGSHRVKRLTGMRFEAMERYDDAIQLYDRILQEDSTNTAARKRKIAIRKAQGKNLEAIRELNEYLEQFVGDQEAWHELAELYINEHDYAKAAFCLEELMMTNPHNHLYCQQYAEVKYTQGGLENLELSRKYFAQALKLNNRNMRALFGLYMSASHIASNPKASAKMKKDNMKYASWAANQINRAYQTGFISNAL
uniref:ER membrane protein complex subunit 2 n=1 Tax=Cairina moschata TaxID=8855 RepID=A0A8C3BR59_CAIMO